MGQRADAVAVLHAAYADASDWSSWLLGLVEALGRVVCDHAGVAVLVLDGVDAALRVRHAAGRAVREHACLLGRLERVQQRAPAALFGATRRATTLSQLGDRAAPDVLLLPATDAAGGLVAAFVLRRRRAATRREQRLFAILGAHLSAAFHFRVAAAERERLRAHARAVEVAGAPEDERDDAPALWRGLLDGGWSIVERFEQHDKRYLVARRLQANERAFLSFTAREVEVVRRSLAGRSTKEIAYELELAPSTVCELLQTAMLKLGVRNRAELADLAADVAGGVDE